MSEKLCSKTSCAKNGFTISSPHSTIGGRVLRWLEESHEPMLYSYLLDPTIRRIQCRMLRARFNLKLSGKPAERADVTGRLARARSAESRGPGN